MRTIRPILLALRSSPDLVCDISAQLKEIEKDMTALAGTIKRTAEMNGFKDPGF